MPIGASAVGHGGAFAMIRSCCYELGVADETPADERPPVDPRDDLLDALADGAAAEPVHRVEGVDDAEDAAPPSPPTSDRAVAPFAGRSSASLLESPPAASQAAQSSADRGEVIPLSRAPEGPAMSVRMTAVFGGLFGLVLIASIFALLIQVFPVEQDEQVAAAASTEAAEAAADAAPPPAEPALKREHTPLPGPWRVSALARDPGIRLVSGTMKRRSFIVALTEAGVPKPEVYRILKSMEGTRSFDRCGKRDEFTVALDRKTKSAVAFEYERSPIEIYQSRRGDDGLLRGERLDLKVRDEEFITAFHIGRDLARSYRALGLEDGVVELFNEALNGRTSTEAFEVGGVVRAILVEKTSLGGFVRYERATALEYRPPGAEAKPLRAYYFEGDHFKGYVDERGRKRIAKGWRHPVPGAPMTSPFNLERMHPVLKRVRPHLGTDFGAPTGTPVYAAFRGEIRFVGYKGANGNLVAIDHPGGVSTYYAHLSRFAPALKVGTKVATRQVIGYVGSTGRSTGPHLHFGAKRNRKFFDPMTLKLDAISVVPIAERGAFVAVRQKLDQRLSAIPMPVPLPEPEAEPEPAEPAEQAGAEPAEEPMMDGETGTERDADAKTQDLVGPDLSREPE